MPLAEANEIIGFLSSYLTDRRKRLIDEVLSQRTRHIAIALEDVFKPQNASAVLRTCECQGVQDLYIIENENIYEVNPDVVKGATKWLTIHHFLKQKGTSNTPACFQALREQGYHIVGTDPHSSKTIDELDIKNKTALVFGTEYQGLTDWAKSNVDELVSIPMYGFTESYNLSVSAAICLQSIFSKLRKSDVDWRLSADEKLALKVAWYKGQVREADLMIQREFGARS